ncbi:MAG: glycosyltransferase [Actinomycetota bacterium]|nr:glycosyltransferase [Actinomycetota bacterium]
MTAPLAVTSVVTADRLGDELVRRGAINEADLAAALTRQNIEGVQLGRALMTDGAVSRSDLYQSLAVIWGLPFVDLIADPPEVELLDRIGSVIMLRDQWVPRRIAGHQAGDGRPRLSALVATSRRPTAQLSATIKSALDVDIVEFAATTDWDIESAVLNGCEGAMIEVAANSLVSATPAFSAQAGWWPWQKIAAVAIVVGVLASAVADFRVAVITAIIGLNAMFLVGVVFKIVLGAVGIARVARDHRRPTRDRAGAPRLPDHALPIYTILVPAYRESNIVGKIIDHLAGLDYPQSKLQILLLMEADDVATIAAARLAHPPECVRFVIVPAGGPQTKPKACNIGLALAEGDYLVIYDAEDLPDGGQLRSVLAQFDAADDDVICLQARLNYFNADENILTRMFALEYSYWFDCMLPGLDRCGLPIPLGGTSNHFRVDRLRELGGWDPHNVTEDADLGVRAYAQGLTVGINDSTTWEEACSQWRPWIKQRTRWIKGYMVTTLVHTRHPVRLWRTGGVRGLVGLIGLIAGTPLMFLACPPLWAFRLYTFLGGSVHGLNVPSWVLAATTINLVVGNLSMIALTALAALRRRTYHLVAFSLLLPVYWVLHSFAAWRALVHLLWKPDHWEKTPHGIVHGPPARRDARV